MVFITPIVGAAALLSGFAAALPRPDSSINEPAVSAPNGTPITDTSSPQATSVSSSSSGSSSYGSNSGSSYGSSSGSNYGSSGSSSWDSSYGSGSNSGSYGSGSSYGSNSGSYGSGSNYGSGESWGTTTALATSTSTAWNSYSTPSYGSGNSNWGNQGYNDCVQQCVASYGGLPATYTPTATNAGTYGSGATHTVIVAPSQGVLRYVPFAVNASVGDTIKFMWGANNHTVTKSSELTPCNKTSDSPFTSGVQQKDFVFTQVVNDTNPTFFYCGVPSHCQKGMFGIVNPPNAFSASTSVSNMMPAIAAGNSDVAAYASYTSTQVAGNSQVATWGNSIDMGSLPDWSHQYIAENVLYTKNFLASNPEVLKADGSIDLSASGSTPLMIPQDLSAALNSASPASSSLPAANTPVASPAASSAAPGASGSTENLNSGALSMSSNKVVVGLVAAFATFMML